MKQSVVYIGVDVSKAYLDIAWAAASRRFPNDRNGHAALVLWIKQSAGPVQLICEASGGYEQGLLESLEQNNLAVTLVQAIRVRQYARAAASWPRPTRSMQRSWRHLAQRCNRSQPLHSLPSKSACVNTKHSVGT